MRILKVQFKNLNSLYGEWSVDLTHPSYFADGIFAITGPTGAGKSTLLDAVCLALYGSTPRLGRITKGGNEVMSRRTGECSAEVTFDTRDGRYRCSWSQRRAMGKPGGKLQQPTHEISDAATGKLLETKGSAVALLIESITGMDFARFTRSMLLAQGDFAAFLHSKPDDRAPILEQITGTEIYSEISKRTHVRLSEERKKLEGLQFLIEGLHFLSLEDEESLNNELEEKVMSEADLERRIVLKNGAVQWLETVVKLQDELKQIAAQKDDLESRLSLFTPERAKLEAASRALELSGDYVSLSSLREMQQADSSLLDDCAENLPHREEEAGLAAAAVKSSAEKLEFAREAQRKLLPIIRAVRDLDIKISEKGVPIEAAQRAADETSAELEALRVKQCSDSAELELKQKKLAELLMRMDESKSDELLSVELAGITEQFEALKKLESDINDKQSEIKRTEEDFDRASHMFLEQTAASERERVFLAAVKLDLNRVRSELSEMLNGRSIAEWRGDKQRLSGKQGLIMRAAEALSCLNKHKSELEVLASQKSIIEKTLLELEHDLECRNETRSVLQKEIEQLEEESERQRRIEDMNGARAQLRDGEPCPLCGSIEHPFVQGDIMTSDKTSGRIHSAKLELNSLFESTADLKAEAAGKRRDLAYLFSGEDEHSAEAEAAESLIRQLFSDLGAEDTDRDTVLKTLEEEALASLERVEMILNSAETLDGELGHLLEQHEKALELAAIAESEAGSAAHRKEFMEESLSRLNGEMGSYNVQRDKSLAVLNQRLLVFGYGDISVRSLDKIHAELTIRRNEWTVSQRSKSELEQGIAFLLMQTNSSSDQISKYEYELGRQRSRLDALISERDSLIRHRDDMFGDKKTDEEEMFLSDAIDSADRELSAARERFLTADGELSRLRERSSELRLILEERDVRLKMLFERFCERLIASGFSCEESYKLALLPEEERKHLAESSAKLDEERIEISSRENERARLLEEELRKDVTGESVEDLRVELELLTAAQRELRQEIGGIRQRLSDNESSKRQRMERSAELDVQKAECRRWSLLHDLIGSADGKKYRNFAQELTFEIMVRHANRQLSGMSDRYLLIRDEENPLELNVIDNYQAGEVRSTKNLSGGESFIVSLSLALGLSHMASKNVRVDSLFLDEGFGTLDEEALDSALETLAALRRDGKLIGVISHVGALKERISAQIQVVPKSGGRSVISGPGCECIKMGG